jgi:hypothetical protein
VITTGKTNSLLTIYNLSHAVDFATRTQNESSTTIDNISVDITRLSSSSTCPIINGLSDHDAQFLKLIILLQQLTWYIRSRELEK